MAANKGQADHWRSSILRPSRFQAVTNWLSRLPSMYWRSIRDVRQNRLYAGKRDKLLVILQVTDTLGKKGTLCGVFSRIRPWGACTRRYGKRRARTSAPDYLRRICQRVPRAR
jgi:polyphosphate kinase 2 (PPK2 family)